MKKKVILLLLLFFPFFFFFLEKTSFSLSDVSSAPGSTVTIRFNISKNPEFGVLTARVKFDHSKLEYVSGKLNAFSGASIKGIDKNKSKGLVAIYAISIGDKFKDTGDIAVMEFKINDSIRESVDIPLEVEIVDFGVDDEQTLAYDVKNGIIHVNGAVDTVTQDSKESLTKKIKEKLEEEKKNNDDVTWESSNDDIAKVDDGVVEFKEDGNVTVQAKDKDGNVVYSKDYYVKGKNVNKNNNIVYYVLVIGIVIILFGLFIWRKKWKRKRIK